jgi:hypothetical protein
MSAKLEGAVGEFVSLSLLKVDVVLRSAAGA